MLKHLASFLGLAFICTSIVSAQDYLITFSGSGESTTVETVEVKNIDQQTTLTLSGTDTLLLTDVVGTSHLPPLNQGMIIYPNPANHASRLEFYNSSAGNTLIEIYDFSGRLLILKSIQLSAGNHSFTISGLNAGIYIIKVNTLEHIDSRRLVSTSVKHLAPDLQYEGRAEIRRDEHALKCISNIVAMQYNDCERLVFKAISGEYAHTKSLGPTGSQNIDFEFMDCIDGDGNQYGVVTIGEQVWMTENLKTTKYRNGASIEYPGSDTSAWNNNITGAYAWYDNDISWKDSYGALYNWHAVNNNNGLCPIGWYVPSYYEWIDLVDHLAAQGFPNQALNDKGAGNALKSCKRVNSPLGGACSTFEHPRWENDTISGHDIYGFDGFGFSALPGGNRSFEGAFPAIGSNGNWWASTGGSSYAWTRGISYRFGTVSMYYWPLNFGHSVRCIKE